MEKLVAAGVSVGAVDRDGRTALMLAVLTTPPSPQMILALLRAGVDANAKDKGQAWAALAFAARDCDVEICRLLLDAGADIDAVDVFGNTALMRAIVGKKTENVTLLLARGADPDRKNKRGVAARIDGGAWACQRLSSCRLTRRSTRTPTGGHSARRRSPVS
jgi:uncharacterized protein